MNGLIGEGEKGIASFENALNRCVLPAESSIQHEGLYFDYYFQTHNELERLFAADYSFAISKDPLNGEKEFYMCIGLASCMDGKNFYARGGRPPINVVMVLDISGSMGSPFTGESKSKLDVAKESLLALIERLTPKDKFGLVLFDTAAKVVQPLQQWDSINTQQLKQAIMDIKEGGGTTLSVGFDAATAQFKNIDTKDAVAENRIIFFTDMIPNERHTDGMNLFSNVREHSLQKLYTTFIGVGVDFDTSLVSLIGSIRACNYTSVKSSKEFKKFAEEEFDYLVTPIVFDCSISLDAQGWTPVRVYGSPGHEIPSKGVLVEIESFFPSLKEGDTLTKGGMTVVKLKKEAASDAALKLNTSYVDRTGTQHTFSEEFKIPDVSENSSSDSDYFQTVSARKAVLLTRYVNFMKLYLRDVMNKKEHEPLMTFSSGIGVPEVLKDDQVNSSVSMSPLSEHYKKLFKAFVTHFEQEMDTINDKMLDREHQLLLKIYEHADTQTN